MRNIPHVMRSFRAVREVIGRCVRISAAKESMYYIAKTRLPWTPDIDGASRIDPSNGLLFIFVRGPCNLGGQLSFVPSSISYLSVEISSSRPAAIFGDSTVFSFHEYQHDHLHFQCYILSPTRLYSSATPRRIDHGVRYQQHYQRLDERDSETTIL